MLISKFDLYKTGWLDLVFESRNKAYGAYELRQHYAGNLVKAMGITFLSIAVLCGGGIAWQRAHPRVNVILVDMTPPVIPPPTLVQPKKITPPAEKIAKTLPPQEPPTQRVVTMVVGPDDKAEKPVENANITKAISTVDSKGTGPGTSVLPVETPGPAIETIAPPDETVHMGADVMPEPDGGVNAWSKFLNRNLRFPVQAEESGRVILSFVVEKDGHLSNIVIEKAAGHGFDEEALRVLKLAKPWKPGLQSGQPIRVKYTIPINFQLSE